VIEGDAELSPVTWPANIPVEGIAVVQATDLMSAFLTAALLLLLVDAIAALWLAGRLTGPIGRTASVLVIALALGAQAPSSAFAQSETNGDGLTLEDELALLATSEVTLAYVVTGDPELDRTSEAGLQGLTNTLWARTSVEPAPPIGVNLETDELAFFPMLYWPVSPEQEMPSAEAYRRLNDYLRSGGMIVSTRGMRISAASDPARRRAGACACWPRPWTSRRWNRSRRITS
jgi:hypothetical protein